MNITLLLFLLLGIGHAAYSQCQSSVKVSDAKIQPTGLGRIEVRVKSTGTFSAQLVAYKGAAQQQIKNFNGRGDRAVAFDELKPDMIYRVVVTFDSESEFLCHKKSTDEILLNDRK